MPKIAVVTDTNSGITVERGRQMGVKVIPMPVHIDGKIFYESVDLDQKTFYDYLLSGAEVATSQPAPAEVTGLWDEVLRDYDQLVYIPMSAGLSASLATAQMLAQDYDGRVQVVDNRRISVTQRFSVQDAVRLAGEGLSAAEIKAILEEQADDSCIYITVDTLKYLRKGGRVSGVEAIAGTMLNIKPVMEIRGEKLNAIAKVRGMKAARKLMIQKVKDDINGRLKHLRDTGHLAISIACSKVSDELREDWWNEVCSAFQGENIAEGDPLTLSIACHTGPGALGVGAVRI